MASKKTVKHSPKPLSGLQRYGLLLVPNFSLIALAAVVDPLRLANGVFGRKVYEYVTLGAGREAVVSSDGIRVMPDLALTDSGDLDAAFVIGPNPIPKRGFGDVSNWLRRQAARGVALGGWTRAAISWRAPVCWTATDAPSTGRTATPCSSSSRS